MVARRRRWRRRRRRGRRSAHERDERRARRPEHGRRAEGAPRGFGYTGILRRPLRPVPGLLLGSSFEVSKGWRSHLPNGPGAFPATLPPVLNVLLTPRWGLDESRGARKPRISKTMQMATTARMVMHRAYPSRDCGKLLREGHV